MEQGHGLQVTVIPRASPAGCRVGSKSFLAPCQRQLVPTSYYTPSGRAAGTLSRPGIICVHTVWLRSPGDVVQGCCGSQSACLAGWQGSGVALLFLSHLMTQKHTRKALIHGHLSSPIPFTLSTVNMVISSFTSNLLLPLLPPSVGSYSCVEKRGLSLVTVPHYP